ncbi:hypothetical protein E4U57_006097, partial [Claviceps arundinis]
MHTNAQIPPDTDTEVQHNPEQHQPPTPVFKSLRWLDRFLALWIFLAMLTGILLGNFAPRTGEVLDQGRWVGVSIPI